MKASILFTESQYTINLTLLSIRLTESTPLLSHLGKYRGLLLTVGQGPDPVRWCRGIWSWPVRRLEAVLQPSDFSHKFFEW